MVYVKKGALILLVEEGMVAKYAGNGFVVFEPTQKSAPKAKGKEPKVEKEPENPEK